MNQWSHHLVTGLQSTFYMSEQTKECIEIHSLEELKKLIMEKDDNEILTITVEVAADEA